MKKVALLIVLCMVVFTLSQCTKQEEQNTRERTAEAVNDAFTLTTNALRNVAEGVNDAVYK